MKNIGDHVCFRLDGRWIGCGTVTYVFSDKTVDGFEYVIQYAVRLTVECKEFPAGTEVLVGPEELF